LPCVWFPVLITTHTHTHRRSRQVRRGQARDGPPPRCWSWYYSILELQRGGGGSPHRDRRAGAWPPSSRRSRRTGRVCMCCVASALRLCVWECVYCLCVCVIRSCFCCGKLTISAHAHWTEEEKECMDYVLNKEAGSSDKNFQNDWMRDREPETGQVLQGRDA
jgi:hypothetical protein